MDLFPCATAGTTKAANPAQAPPTMFRRVNDGFSSFVI
jgi:hypothetical protein